MPDYAFLLRTDSKRPLSSRQSGQEIACSADVPPLGWLALYTTDHIKLIGEAPQHRLTLFASVKAARENLGRRRPVLEEVFSAPVASHLHIFDKHLERLPATDRVQMWLGGLIFPWPATARPTLEARLHALDGRDHDAWRALLLEVQARIEPDSLKGRFARGVAVNACVGWLDGEPCPGPEME